MGLTVREARVRLEKAELDQREGVLELEARRLQWERRDGVRLHTGAGIRLRQGEIGSVEDDTEETVTNLDVYAFWLERWRRAGVYDGPTELTFVGGGPSWEGD